MIFFDNYSLLLSIPVFVWCLALYIKLGRLECQRESKFKEYRNLPKISVAGGELADRLSSLFSKDNFVIVVNRKSTNTILRLLGLSSSSCSTSQIKNGSKISLNTRVFDEPEVKSAASVLQEFGHALDNYKNQPLKNQKTLYSRVSLLASLGFFYLVYGAIYFRNNYQSIEYLSLASLCIVALTIVSYTGYMSSKITLQMEASASRTAIKTLSETREILRLVGVENIDHVKDVLHAYFLSYEHNILLGEVIISFMLAVLIMLLPVGLSMAIFAVYFISRKWYTPFVKLKGISLSFDNDRSVIDQGSSIVY